MISQYKKVSDVVSDFECLLRQYPDNVKYFTFYTQYLKTVLRTKIDGTAVPTIEIMTLIKHERPVIYSIIKKLSGDTMYFLTNISMDYEEAKTRLNRLHHSQNEQSSPL